MDIPYRRDVMIQVLIYHWRRSVEGCGCGWSELGKSHPEHIVDVYEESIRVKEQTEVEVGIRGIHELRPGDSRATGTGIKEGVTKTPYTPAHSHRYLHGYNGTTTSEPNAEGLMHSHTIFAGERYTMMTDDHYHELET